MFPYLKDEVKLRFDLENPIIFLRNGCLWLDESLNRDGQRVLSFCNGTNSLPLILKKIKKCFPSESGKELETKIQQFFVSARLKGYLNFSEEPTDKPVIFMGSPQKFFPAAIIIELTQKCNLTCRHCYIEKHQKNNDFYDLKFLKIFLAQAYQKGAYQLQLTGGEPFLYPDILGLIEFAVSKFTRLMVTTNATLITPEISKKLAVFKNLAFQVSLDGDEETHNFIRGGDFAFGLMAQGLRCLLAEGHQVKLAATISSLNINRMEEIAQTALALGVNFLEYGVAIPIGRAQKLKPLSLTDYKFIYENTKSLAEIYRNKGLNIKFYQEEQNFQCRLIHDLIFIVSSGDVFPCTGLKTRLGNIKKQSLDEIFSSSKLKKISQLAAPNKDSCESCSLLEFCSGCHVQGLKNSGLAKVCSYSEKACSAGLKKEKINA